MTEIIDPITTITCLYCGKQRRVDRRMSCEHCGKMMKKTPRPAEDRIEGQDLVVVASDPQEMVTAQRQMIARLDEKIAAAEAEHAQALDAVASIDPAAGAAESPAAQSLIARAQEQIEASSKKLAAIAERRLVYLKKVRAALDAGYVMMPNFPGHVIAIRTARKRPAVPTRYDVSLREDAAAAAPDAALLPGEGKYVSPTPEHTHDRSGDRQAILIEGWDEEIALPVEFLKPTVVQRTVTALELKIFDQIVLVRDGESRDSFAGQSAPPRGRDPMVVGRILLRKPGASRWERPRTLSFLIAWFMDTALI